MAYLDNAKFKEILTASRDGNEKAQVIMQAMRKGSPQGEIDRLVDSYYDLGKVPDEVLEIGVESVEVPSEEEVQPEIPQQLQPEVVSKPENPGDIEDYTKKLDCDTEGLFDESDFEDMSFKDFIKNKNKDTFRNKHNADYFKMYGPDERMNYMNGKIDAYKNKFNGNLKQIERNFNDTDRALNGYLLSVNDTLDDDIELSDDNVSGVYDKMTNNSEFMNAFGRYWDKEDNDGIVGALRFLIGKYGKKNVIAALNVLKGDNENHRNFLNNQIDQNIGKYTKSVEKLFK